VDVWRSLNAAQKRPWNSLNNVEAFSFFLSYNINRNFYAQFQYSVDRVKVNDLSQILFNSSYFLRAGYRWKINRLNELRTNIGFGVITEATHGAYVTEVQGRPETRRVQHVFLGKEPFRQWAIGLDYRHNISEAIFVGLDVVYNFTFEWGRTYFSPYLGFNLSDLKKAKDQE